MRGKDAELLESGALAATRVAGAITAHTSAPVYDTPAAGGGKAVVSRGTKRNVGSNHWFQWEFRHQY